MIDLRRLLRGREPETVGTFGIAVVGLGRIAEHFLRGVADSPTVRVTALVSGDAAKAGRLGRQYGVSQTLTYAEFDTLRDRPEVQAVYLALPVSMHREYTARAAAAGKHVLVEKPMASDAAECRAMIADCAAAGVVLSVAYRCPFDPMHQRLRQRMHDGSLGVVERIESQFGFALAADDWRYDAALAGGGSAYDVGVYPLNAARYLMGVEPEIETAAATVTASGMETSIRWTMPFPGGVEAACASSYLERMPDVLTVRGTGGELTLQPAFGHKEPLRLRGWCTDPATGRRVDVDEETPRETPSHFRLEAEHLEHAVRAGERPVTSGEDGLRDMELIERMYAVAGVGGAGNATA